MVIYYRCDWCNNTISSVYDKITVEWHCLGNGIDKSYPLSMHLDLCPECATKANKALCDKLKEIKSE